MGTFEYAGTACQEKIIYFPDAQGSKHSAGSFGKTFPRGSGVRFEPFKTGSTLVYNIVRKKHRPGPFVEDITASNETAGHRMTFINGKPSFQKNSESRRK
jgi:hypothetical protein